MNKYLEYAGQLHRKFPVVDAHRDLAAEIYWRNLTGEDHVIESHLLPGMRRGGVRVIVSSIFIENSFLPGKGMDMTLRQIEALRNDIEHSSGQVMFIRSVQDLEFCLKQAIPGIILYCEGLDQIGTDIDRLNEFYAMGIRGASLTWSRRDDLGQGCCPANLHEDWKGGLTECGRAVLSRLEELGMFIDVSHLNDDGFDELSSYTKKTFIATHSNCRAVYDSYRNLRDDQIQTLAAQGGIMGLNGCLSIVGTDRDKPESIVPKMIDHIDHIVKSAGASHAGYGFDFCDSYYQAYATANNIKGNLACDCLPDAYAQVPELTAEMLRRGYSEESIAGIIGGNFIGYFKKLLPLK